MFTRNTIRRMAASLLAASLALVCSHALVACAYQLAERRAPITNGYKKCEGPEVMCDGRGQACWRVDGKLRCRYLTASEERRLEEEADKVCERDYSGMEVCKLVFRAASTVKLVPENVEHQ